MSNQINSKHPNQSQEKHLIELFQKKNFKEAEKIALSLTKDFPNYLLAWKILGSILYQTQRIKEAVFIYNKILKISPQDSNSLNNLGICLKAIGKFSDAKIAFLKAIALRSDYPEAHNNLGATLRSIGELGDSEISFRNAIALKSDYSDAYNNLATVLRLTGRLTEAEKNHNKAIALRPDFSDAYSNLGATLRALSKFDDAERSYLKAIALSSKNEKHYYNLAILYTDLGKFDKAKNMYIKAIDLNPNFAEAHRQLTQFKKFNLKDEDFKKLEILYSKKDISDRQLCHVNFSLAKAYEDMEDFERAFMHLEQGNALKKKYSNFNLCNTIKKFEDIKSNSSKFFENILTFNTAKTNPIPIFIIGMPRSGTTLVEQIISSHSQVTAGGEIPHAYNLGIDIAQGIAKPSKENLSSFQQNYQKKIEFISNSSAFITDKLPQNFLLVGLLANTFPKAKFVHVTRNSAAVCWSNYKLYSDSAVHDYTYCLDDIVHYFKEYKAIMNFWEEKFPNKIYTINYDKLTINQDYETQQLIKKIGLSWEFDCLTPQDNPRSVSTAANIKVRRKIYQGSSEEWRMYKPYLNDIFSSLEG